eukprot:879002-Rhodomonas_salina.2
MRPFDLHRLYQVVKEVARIPGAVAHACVGDAHNVCAVRALCSQPCHQTEKAQSIALVCVTKCNRQLQKKVASGDMHRPGCIAPGTLCSKDAPHQLQGRASRSFRPIPEGCVGSAQCCGREVAQEKRVKEGDDDNECE